MARCYSDAMRKRQPSLPRLWLISDKRNDAALEHALRRLPRGSGFIFRHYHLAPDRRRARFDALVRIARARGHLVILSGKPQEALGWGADGAYGPPTRLARGPATLRLVTAHSLREIRLAQTARADAILLSPVFPTRSHPGGKALGPVRFHLLARHAQVPVIALGGMTAKRVKRLKSARWAAIDGLS
ncbi:MAG: thiamine phosphate synthase [Sphingomonadaceae bacterium]